MNLALNTGTQVIIIFLLMAVGFVFSKSGRLSVSSVKEMTDILLTLVCPCVLIHSYQQKEFSRELASNLGYAFLFSFAVHIIGIIVAKLIFRKEPSERYRINRYSAVFSNCGFMAIPLLSATLGADGVFFGSAYIAVFTIVTWTYGILLMSGDKKYMSFRKILANPGIIGTSIALVLFVCNLRLPAVVLDTLGYISDLNTPVAMIVLGTYLVNIKLKDVIKCRDIYLCIAARLFIVPLIAVMVATVLPIDTSVKIAVLIPAACPTAALATLFAARFEKGADYASEVVSVTTLLSVISIPLIIIFAGLAGIH